MSLPQPRGGERWPDGSDAAPALTGTAFRLQAERLALAPGRWPWMARAATWRAFVAPRRPDAPVPLALASFGYQLEDRAPLRAFAVAPLLPDSWGRAEPALRSRVVTWWLDARFRLVDDDPGSQPGALLLDAGDGLGPRPVPPDGRITAAYGLEVAQVFLVLHDGPRRARTSVAIGTPAAPLPDRTLTLPGGTAWVFLAPGHAQPQRPVLIAEGFPGGYACDYLHDMLNQHGLAEAIRAEGRDLVLLGFANGAGPMEANAPVVEAAIAALRQTATAPLAVGGVSMGGLVTRLALASLERRGLDHGCALYLSIDSPHGGAYTPLAVQWFAQAYAGVLGGAADAAGLLATPANQQFVRRFLRRDGTGWASGPSPLRASFEAHLAAAGDWPRRPRRVAIACGRGDGVQATAPGATLLRWTGGSMAQAALHALPAGGSAVVADGSGTALPPLEVTSELAWEGLPGSTNTYVALCAAMAGATGDGRVEMPAPSNLSVPTVSALAMDLPPERPIPPDAPTPFHAWHHADENLPHLQLTPALRDALLAEIRNLPAEMPT